MERWLIVDLMHLIGVAMRMILGNCEILVLLLGMKQTLKILRFLRVPACCLSTFLLLSMHLFLLLAM